MRVLHVVGRRSDLHCFPAQKYEIISSYISGIWNFVISVTTQSCKIYMLLSWMCRDV